MGGAAGTLGAAGGWGKGAPREEFQDNEKHARLARTPPLQGSQHPEQQAGIGTSEDCDAISEPSVGGMDEWPPDEVSSTFTMVYTWGQGEGRVQPASRLSKTEPTLKAAATGNATLPPSRSFL